MKVAVIAALGGCTAHPPGEADERQSAIAAGKSFQRPFEQRAPESLPEHATAEDVVRYALLNSADLEARYWQWRAAVEQVPQDGTQSTTLNLTFGSAITRGRTSNGLSNFGASNDPMTDIKWPGKLDASAKIALQNARAAGLRFRKAQFELRNKVLFSYYDYALNAELIRLSGLNHNSLEATANITESRNRAGMLGGQDVLKARTEADLSRNDVQYLQSQLPALRANLNAILNRPAGAALPDPALPESTSPLRRSDEDIVRQVAARNPELDAQAAEIRGRAESVRLAGLQYIPDFNLSASGDLAGITQNLLGQVTVPLLRYEALNAAVAQAEANLRAAEATRRQTVNDLAAGAVQDAVIIRDADRQLALFDQTLLARARLVVDLGRTNYESGRGSLLDLLDAQRTLISLQRLVANLRVTRARRVADLEMLAADEIPTGPT